MRGKKHDPDNLWQQGTIHVLIPQVVLVKEGSQTGRCGDVYHITTLRIVVMLNTKNFQCRVIASNIYCTFKLAHNVMLKKVPNRLFGNFLAPH